MKTAMNDKVIEDLYQVIKDRKVSPIEGSYTKYLFDKGLDKILKKVGEEATEVIVASKNEDKTELITEICDLCYHMLVLMAQKDISLEEIREELEKRRAKTANKKPERAEINNL
jgi:phosphoribosyl-ATP pyrophosphohydrolase